MNAEHRKKIARELSEVAIQYGSTRYLVASDEKDLEAQRDIAKLKLEQLGRELDSRSSAIVRENAPPLQEGEMYFLTVRAMTSLTVRRADGTMEDVDLAGTDQRVRIEAMQRDRKSPLRLVPGTPSTQEDQK